MRWLGFLLMLAIATSAYAEQPPTNDALFAQITAGKPAARRAAAKQLARRVATDADARELATIAVLTDDAGVRAPLVDALITSRVLSREAAAHVPTAGVLAKRLAALLLPKKVAAMPVSGCRVTGGTARGATIECRHSRCRPSCIHETTTATVATGLRWKLIDVHVSGNEDGVCGHCQMFD